MPSRHGRQGGRARGSSKCEKGHWEAKRAHICQASRTSTYIVVPAIVFTCHTLPLRYYNVVYNERRMSQVRSSIKGGHDKYDIDTAKRSE